jgi:uncharacterized protein
MDQHLIDTHAFTRRADRLAGRQPVAGLERLASLLAGPEGELDWSLVGRSELGADGSRRSFLRLECSGGLVMRCVRCLEPMPVALELARDYRLVGSEEEAEREDLDEEAVDLLVGSRRFDLASLLEDEAILSLPAAPRHDQCSPPGPAVAHAPQPAADERPNPFDALRGLRGPESD